MSIIIRDSKKLGTAIQSIARRGKKLDQDIHIAGVSCMYHMAMHGDVTLTERLIDAMPKSSRRKALMVWFESFTPVNIDRVEGKVKLKKERSGEDFKVEAAEAQPFWDFTQEKEPSPITVASIRSYLTRVAEGNAGKAPVEQEAKDAARELLATLPKLVKVA